MRLHLFSVLVAVSTGALAFVHAAEANASYQEKAVSYWFDLALKGTNVDAAFKAMGSNAAPFLARQLERSPSWLDEKIADFPKKPYVPEGVYEHSLHRVVSVIRAREEAARLLCELGPDAEPALPALLRIFREGDERENIQASVNCALRGLGERIAFLVPELLQNFTNNQRHVQILCADLLGSIGPKARAAVPALSAAVEQSGLSWAAAGALWKIDQQTNVYLRVLTQGLTNANATTRMAAMYYLRSLGQGANPATSMIAAALRDEDGQVREAAVKALKELDPELLESRLQELNQQATATIARLIETIRTGEFPRRYRAVEAIALFGPAAKDAVPVLIETLDRPVAVKAAMLAEVAQHYLWRIAADALGEIGPDASAAVPKLIELSHKSKQYAAMSYCPALGKIGTNAHSAVPVLQNLLQDEDRRLRLAAADALTRIAPQECSNVVAVLTNLQYDAEAATVWISDGSGLARRSDKKDFQNRESVFLRLSASIALWRLRVEKEPPVEALAELAAKVTSMGGELWAKKSLGEIGPAAKSSLPALRAVLGRSSTLHRRTDAIAIRRIDPEEFTELGLPGMLALP